MEVSMTVNGTTYTNDVEPRTLLVHHLRENVGLTGTHVGCDTSQCGACTVLIDGEAVKSCTLLAVQADGADITTVEGLADDEIVVNAWLAEDLGVDVGDTVAMTYPTFGPRRTHPGLKSLQGPLRPTTLQNLSRTVPLPVEGGRHLAPRRQRWKSSGRCSKTPAARIATRYAIAEGKSARSSRKNSQKATF